MAFRYRKKRTKKPPAPSRLGVDPFKTDELTGQVRGEKASDLEERFAHALERMELEFDFQVPVETKYTLPDKEKQVDFIVEVGLRQYPVEIYGEYFHSTDADKFRDKVRERDLNDVFSKMGIESVMVARTHELYSQEVADETARRMFL